MTTVQNEWIEDYDDDDTLIVLKLFKKKILNQLPQAGGLLASVSAVENSKLRFQQLTLRAHSAGIC
eukprot:scaffold292083_cov16-Prasinocladus_malaysianus.AAC.1